jgi:hypothetical protein
MAWIDYLPEVGDPIRRDRAKLHELAEQAAELERHAVALRGLVRAGQAELLAKVMRRWTLADIQSAAQAADRADPVTVARAQVEDAALRERLRSLDGWHLASEALQAFDDAVVIRQPNLLGSATEEERSQTLARVLAWWNHAGRPVCERLGVMK